MNMQNYSLTVGSAYKKAEIPQDTKHCTTLFLTHSCQEEYRKSYSKYFRKAFQIFVLIMMFIKQHQILEYRERELVPDFSSAVLLHKIQSYWLASFCSQCNWKRLKLCKKKKCFDTRWLFTMSRHVNSQSFKLKHLKCLSHWIFTQNICFGINRHSDF